MPQTTFDSAGLAIVAYVQVDGATGSSSPVTGLANSGVSTTRISTGLYQFVLPTAIGQSATKDLIFVQPKATPTTTAIRASQKPVADVLEIDAFTKTVSFMGVANALLSTAIDTDFDVLVLRTILP